MRPVHFDVKRANRKSTAAKRWHEKAGLRTGCGVRCEIWQSKRPPTRGSKLVSPSIGVSKLTGVAGIFAAGDAARWPDPHTGALIRVEHWVVAQRQGQVAAKNILGRREKFDAVPFFWSQHYDVAINYVGRAEKWDAIEIDGSLDARDCAVAYKKAGRTLAIVTISRDLQSLQAKAAMEAEIRSQAQKVA